jgi:AcrR family transcriptional regulator
MGRGLSTPLTHSAAILYRFERLVKLFYCAFKSRMRSGPMAKKSASPAKKTGNGRKAVRWGGVPSLKDHRREAILRSVANVLRNSRFSTLTIQDIADELGMTKGNLYYYFKDKREILYYCHMRSMDISLLALNEALQSTGSPADKLRILLTHHIRAIVDEGFGGILQTDLENLDPDQRRSYVRKRDELEQGVRHLIEDGIRMGQFTCPNIKLTGFAILGAINWIPKWYRPGGPFDPQQIAEQMTEYFVRGLQAPPSAAARRPARERELEKVRDG